MKIYAQFTRKKKNTQHNGYSLDYPFFNLDLADDSAHHLPYPI